MAEWVEYWKYLSIFWPIWLIIGHVSHKVLSLQTDSMHLIEWLYISRPIHIKSNQIKYVFLDISTVWLMLIGLSQHNFFVSQQQQKQPRQQ